MLISAFSSHLEVVLQASCQGEPGAVHHPGGAAHHADRQEAQPPIHLQSRVRTSSRPLLDRHHIVSDVTSLGPRIPSRCVCCVRAWAAPQRPWHVSTRPALCCRHCGQSTLLPCIADAGVTRASDEPEDVSCSAHHARASRCTPVCGALTTTSTAARTLRGLASTAPGLALCDRCDPPGVAKDPGGRTHRGVSRCSLLFANHPRAGERWDAAFGGAGDKAASAGGGRPGELSSTRRATAVRCLGFSGPGRVGWVGWEGLGVEESVR